MVQRLGFYFVLKRIIKQSTQLIHLQTVDTNKDSLFQELSVPATDGICEVIEHDINNVTLTLTTTAAAMACRQGTRINLVCAVNCFCLP